MTPTPSTSSPSGEARLPIEVVPADAERFEDLALLLGPRKPESRVCWCLSYRIPSAENRSLTGPGRREKVRELCGRDLAPGLLAYRGETVVGWVGVAPRAELTSFTRSRTIPHVDDLPVWTVWCFVVRPGHRRQGVAAALLRGAVEFAREHGAPAIEGYPVDNGARRVDTTMAYVGTRGMFEKAGFTKAADTDSVSNRIPRIVMRLPL